MMITVRRIRKRAVPAKAVAIEIWTRSKHKRGRGGKKRKKPQVRLPRVERKWKLKGGEGEQSAELFFSVRSASQLGSVRFSVLVLLHTVQFSSQELLLAAGTSICRNSFRIVLCPPRRETRPATMRTQFLHLGGYHLIARIS